MNDLLPSAATVVDGELTIGGMAASALADEFGTPLVVYCEQTILDQARAYREAASDALVLYSLKAFPNLALLRLVAAEGLGADVSTLGELTFALRAGIPGGRIVVHGNNKSDEERRAAAAGVARVLIRTTPGIDAETHDAIKTAHHGSKFGLPPEQTLEALERARDAGLDVAGLHTHIGSQLLELRAAKMTVEWLAGFTAECRERLEWTPAVVDLGGGLGIQYVDGEPAPPVEYFVDALLERLAAAWRRHDLPLPRLVLEPGRSLVGRAGVTLYRVGTVKRASETTTYVAIDGGMSDNPRPQLYGARYSALLANRADDPPAQVYCVCGKHCESGDVLIDRVALPEPRRGDVLAVPATGAYTLGMGSNYNSVARPAAVLVADGEARVIRRRETIDDLLAFETA